MTETSILSMIANTGGQVDISPEPLVPASPEGSTVRILIRAAHLVANRHGSIATAGTLVRRLHRRGTMPDDVNEVIRWEDGDLAIEGCPRTLRGTYDDETGVYRVRLARRDYRDDPALRAWLEARS